VYISGIDIGYPAERKDIIRFAVGKQAESDVLDLLRGIPEIEYNTPEEKLPEKSNVWKASVLESILGLMLKLLNRYSVINSLIVYFIEPKQKKFRKDLQRVFSTD
jgi:hypothetical protein